MDYCCPWVSAAYHPLKIDLWLGILFVMEFFLGMQLVFGVIEKVILAQMFIWMVKYVITECNWFTRYWNVENLLWVLPSLLLSWPNLTVSYRPSAVAKHMVAVSTNRPVLPHLPSRAFSWSYNHVHWVHSISVYQLYHCMYCCVYSLMQSLLPLWKFFMFAMFVLHRIFINGSFIDQK